MWGTTRFFVIAVSTDHVDDLNNDPGFTLADLSIPPGRMITMLRFFKSNYFYMIIVSTLNDNQASKILLIVNVNRARI